MSQTAIDINALPEAKPIPTQARARAKREALIVAATDNFQSLGYEKTTAKTIADTAQVATGTFYQYFHNKDDVLRVIASERLQRLSGHIEAPDTLSSDAVAAFFKKIITFVFDFHEQAPQLHRVLEQRRHCDPHLQAILKQAEHEFSQRTLDFVKRFAINDPEAVAFNLYAMTEGLVHSHVLGDQQRDHPLSKTSKQQIISLGADMLGSYFNDKALKPSK